MYTRCAEVENGDISQVAKYIGELGLVFGLGDFKLKFGYI
jgi:hypothetical protein